MNRALLGVAGLMLSFCFTGALSAEPVKGRVSTYDCSQHPGLSLPATGLHLVLVDRTSASNKHSLPRLGALVCEAAVASGHVADSERRGSAWLNGLQVELVDDVGRMRDQAYFKRDILGKPSRLVIIASGLLERRLEKQFLFVLGHELAHGIYFDHEKKAAVSVGGKALVVGGFGYAAVIKGGARRLAGAAVGVAGLGVAACGPGRLNVANELRADAFAIRVMEETGIPLEEAKAEAIKLMESHQEDDPGCVQRPDGTFGVPNAATEKRNNRHPDTTERIRAIADMGKVGHGG